MSIINNDVDKIDLDKIRSIAKKKFGEEPSSQQKTRSELQPENYNLMIRFLSVQKDGGIQSCRKGVTN